MYHYRAKARSVYDADTVRLDIDLGFGVWLYNQSVRLYGINAPEVSGVERPDGLVSRDRLRERLLEQNVVIQTFKDTKGKYGRWLGVIWLGGENINEWLVSEGLAEVAEY